MAITLDELKAVAKIPNLLTARQFASKAVSIVKPKAKQAQPVVVEPREQVFKTKSQVIELLEKQGVWQL